jgi:hypothetical protein
LRAFGQARHLLPFLWAEIAKAISGSVAFRPIVTHGLAFSGSPASSSRLHRVFHFYRSERSMSALKPSTRVPNSILSTALMLSIFFFVPFELSAFSFELPPSLLLFLGYRHIPKQKAQIKCSVCS